MSPSIHKEENKRNQPPSWRSMNADTSPSVEKIQFKFFRQAPAWRKLEIAGEMREAMLLFVRSDLESRYPQASADEIWRLMADRIVGPELAQKAYGPCTFQKDK
ncbi:hypothetical protein KF707_21825 [Candidatus Obscuribacterales bacterium]|nr:hypothetical protein [Candidatus Obscuribacterales bacterium]MBX3138881.1 hypothetical protein [Candidatus Obscuribacterales bacterium]MBX3152213.1 hypothetical protein [Candidatus Obscuribacterales bacterium]